MSELLHEDKPWGAYDRYTLNEVSTVKIIRVAPGSRLSLQHHKEREELWVALDEGLEVEIAGEVHALRVAISGLTRLTTCCSSAWPTRGGSSCFSPSMLPTSTL